MACSGAGRSVIYVAPPGDSGRLPFDVWNVRDAGTFLQCQRRSVPETSTVCPLEAPVICRVGKAPTPALSVGTPTKDQLFIFIFWSIFS